MCFRQPSSAILPEGGGVILHEGLRDQCVPRGILTASILSVAKEGCNIWMGVLDGWLRSLSKVGSWSRLTWRPVQCGSNVAGRILADVSLPSQLGTELVKLGVSAWESSLEWLQQGEEVLRADSTSF